MIKQRKKILATSILLFSVTPLFAQTLSGALQHALTSNPEILFNRAKTLAAREAVRKAAGDHYPSVDLEMGYGEEKTNNPVTNSIGGSSSNTWLNRKEFNLELRENIFAGFGIEGEVKRQKYLWQAQEYKTLGLSDDLALKVTDNYLEVIKQEQLYAYAKENLREHERIFSMIEHRSSAGVSRRAEMEQAKGRLALANANFLSAENDLRDARVSFRRVIGERAKNLQWPKIPVRGHLPRNLPSAIQQGLDNHPTLLSAYADIKEAKAQYQVAKANDYPRIDAVLGTRQDNNINGLVGQNTDKIAIVRLKYNLYRGGADDARKQETAYQVQEAYEVKNKTIDEIKESVRLSWYAWLTAGHRLGYLKSHVVSANETREAYGEQFKVGKRTLLDLLDSQNEYYQAKIEALGGQYDEVYARFRILNSEGMLLKFLNGRLPITVYNDDAATSHERFNYHQMDLQNAVAPKVDLSDKAIKPFNREGAVKPKAHQTHKITMPPRTIVPRTWVVYVKKYQQEAEAKALVSRLRKMSFRSNYVKGRDAYWVYLGNYEYRAQAAQAMKGLFERTKMRGSLVSKQQKKKG